MEFEFTEKKLIINPESKLGEKVVLRCHHCRPPHAQIRPFHFTLDSLKWGWMLQIHNMVTIDKEN